jgi:hypothetical protein
MEVRGNNRSAVGNSFHRPVFNYGAFKLCYTAGSEDAYDIIGQFCGELLSRLNARKAVGLNI